MLGKEGLNLVSKLLVVNINQSSILFVAVEIHKRVLPTLYQHLSQSYCSRCCFSTKNKPAPLSLLIHAYKYYTKKKKKQDLYVCASN